VDRINERAHRLAITQAISQLNKVDRRLPVALLAPGRALGPHHPRAAW
jgi:hypothetical protein